MTAVAAPTAVADAVVAGHIALDMYPELAGPVAYEPGRLNVVGPALISAGGSVFNTGVALHRLGVPVRLVAKVGADLFGEAVLDTLAQLPGDLSSEIVVSERDVTSYTIAISPPGVDRTFLHCPGANRSFRADDVSDRALAGARVFHFGYPPLMREMYAQDGAQLRALFERVQGLGPATSLDLCGVDPHSEAGRIDWERVLEKTMPFVDVFAPSIEELLFMVDRPAHRALQQSAGIAAFVDAALLADLGERMIGLGAAVAAIKLGDQGLYLRTAGAGERIGAFCERLGLSAEAWRDREVLAPCFEVPAVAGTTGSGDATIAGLLAALLRGEDPATAATSATAVGACSVEAVDPTSAVPAWSSVAARLAAGWPRRALAIELGENVGAQRGPTGTLTLSR
jgi:sugar/nucleoside kinase (ribokinase family)